MGVDMHYGLRLPSFALGPETASLADMGAYLRRAEDLGFETAMLIDHLLVSRAAVERVTGVATSGPEPRSVTDNPLVLAGAPGSDHRPLVATISP